MPRLTGQRVLIALSLAALLPLVATAAAGAWSAPELPSKAGTQIDASPEAVVVGPANVTPVVYVATGMDFPDALGAGPIAGITDAPILLVNTNSIPVETAAELTRLSPDRIVIVGGTGVVSAGVETALAGYASAVARLSGPNRFATAAEVSATSYPAPHTFMVYDTSTMSPSIGGGCTPYTGLEVPVTTPGPGTIVVEANVQLWIDHIVQLDPTSFTTYIGTSPTDCTADIGSGGDSSVAVMYKEPAGDYWPWLWMKKIMHVDTAGTYTFCINGMGVYDSTDSAQFWFGYMDAMFIPDPGT